MKSKIDQMKSWTEKTEVIDGIKTIYLKPSKKCRATNPQSHRTKKNCSKTVTEMRAKGLGITRLIENIEASVPPIEPAKQKNPEELKALVTFFYPCEQWRKKWFVFAGDKIAGNDFLFYGMVFNSNFPDGKLDSFTLSQLQEIENPFGDTIFRIEYDTLISPAKHIGL